MYFYHKLLISLSSTSTSYLEIRGLYLLQQISIMGLRVKTLVFLTCILWHNVNTGEGVRRMKTEPPGPDVDIPLGDKEKLECELVGCNGHRQCRGYTIQWRKAGNSRVLCNESKYELEDVNLDDTGKYICNTTYQDQPYSGFFHVHVGPRMETTPTGPYVAVELGKRETLECVIVNLCEEKCQPISWTKQGSNEEFDNGPKLHLRNFQHRNAGKYFCKTMCDGLNYSGEYLVHARISIETIPKEGKVDVEIGGDRELQCHLKDCPPTTGCNGTKITWKKDGGQEELVTGEIYNLTNASCNDSGKYTCEAQYYSQNLTGCFEVEVNGIFLDKTPRNNTVDLKLGVTKALECKLGDCKSNKKLKWDIIWRVEGNNATIGHEQELVLKNVKYSDIGRYFCIISEKEKDYIYNGCFDVYVQGPLSMETSPSNVSMNLMLGENAGFRCELKGCPRPGCQGYNVTWEKEDSSTCLGDQNVLKLEKLHYGDAGIYICSTTFNDGIFNASFNLHIEGHPIGTPVITKGNATIAVYDSFNLTCNVSSLHKGVPESNEYIWMRNGTIEQDQTDQIYPYVPEVVAEGEEFTCQLKNKYGPSQEGTTYIKVEAPPVIESPSTNLTYKPQYDAEVFNVSYIISGTNITNLLLKSLHKDLEIGNYTLDTDIVEGTFAFGQKAAKKVTWKWNIDDFILTSCEDVAFFNGDYTLSVEGMAAGRTYEDSSDFKIQVQYPAVWNNTLENQTSPQCKPKTLYCDVCADPAPTNYSWSFMGEELVNGTDAELIFSNVTKENFGQYTCTVKNDIGIKSFNISLEENGFALPPEDFKVVSRTSKTLLLSWKLEVMECYDPERFELRYINGTINEVMDIHAPYCNTEYCHYRRIEGLQPEAKYELELRAKYKGSQEERWFSEYVKTIGETSALPYFNPLETTITEEAILITWEFGPSSRMIPQHEASGDGYVTVAIFYKKENDEFFMRYPENGSIPAENKSAIIEGNFDTSAVYVIQYEVYEGDQLAIRTSVEKPPDRNSSANLGIIIGVVIVVFIGIGIASLIAVGIWHHRKKRSNVQKKLAAITSAKEGNSRQGFNLYENIAMEDRHQSSQNYENLPVHHNKKPYVPDAGLYSNIGVEQPCMEADNKKNEGPELAYADLAFDEDDEPQQKQIHGVEITVDYVDLDHDRMKTGQMEK